MKTKGKPQQISDFKQTYNDVDMNNIKIDLNFSKVFNRETKLNEIRQEVLNQLDAFAFTTNSGKQIARIVEVEFSLRELTSRLIKQESIVEKNTSFAYLDSYKFTEMKQIGTGSYGAVLKGNYLATSVVKKVMHRYNDEDLIREAKLTHFLRNPSTVAFLGLEVIRQSPKNQAMILEHITGNTLRGYLNQLNMLSLLKPENELPLIIYSLDLAKGISYLSKRNAIHRDLKPENLLVSTNFQLKIIDFGITKEKTSTMTQTREAGTLLYFPPENVRDPYAEDDDLLASDIEIEEKSRKRKITSAFDIWCFGLILSEMFGCEPPWGKEKNRVLENLMLGKKFPIPKSISNIIIKVIIESSTNFLPISRMSSNEAISLLFVLFKEKLVDHSKSSKGFQFFKNKKLAYAFANRVKCVLHDMQKENIKFDEIFMKLGNYSNEKNKPEDAMKYFEKAMTHNKNNTQVLRKLASIEIKKENYRSALFYYNKAKEINSQNPSIYIDIGHIYRKLEEYKTAEDYFNYSLKLNQNNDQAYNALGLLFEQLNNNTKAEENFVNAIVISEKKGHLQTENILLFYHDYASFLIKNSRYILADIFCKKALEIEKNHQEMLFMQREIKYLKSFKEESYLLPSNKVIITSIHHLCYDNKNFLCAGSKNGVLKFWDILENKLITTIVEDSGVSYLAMEK